MDGAIRTDALLPRMWSAIGEADATPLTRVLPGGEPGLPSRLPVDALVRDSIAAASLTASLMAGGGHVRLDPARVRTAVASDKVLRVNGEVPSVWAELSGFWRCADGWIRTHANYPHHRARLLDALGLPESAGRDAFAAALAERSAGDVESAVVERGGIAARVRTESEWAAHAQARAVRDAPLVESIPLGGAPRPLVAEPAPGAPLAGVRVLDLTRVIAGPVATRTLALFGADVLRIDDPGLPEFAWQHVDTGAGKRSALLDLRSPGDVRRFDELLAAADVIVTGYRPGSLAGLGWDAESMAERRPGIVVAEISAWGWSGPWGSRRGFDSIVQAASGIASVESVDGDTPGALPVQALDHSAGYLLAAAVMSALRRRSWIGGSRVRTALARIAQELLDLPRLPEPAADRVPDGFPQTVTLPWTYGDDARDFGGEATIARPAPFYDGGPREWRGPLHEWGCDAPSWLEVSRLATD